MNILFASAWIVNIFFWLSLLPQVALNFKLKSARGLSDIMLYLFFVGYIFYNYYIFCFSLPNAYKVMAPISFVTVCVLVAQRFWYTNFSIKNLLLLFLYAATLTLAIVMIPFAYRSKVFFGSVAGWSQCVVWFFYQVPQAVKIQLKKSVLGFSFALVSFIALGEFIEIILALCLSLPIQTVFNGMRGVVMYLIFCAQFWKYKENQLRGIS